MRFGFVAFSPALLDQIVFSVQHNWKLTAQWALLRQEPNRCVTYKSIHYYISLWTRRVSTPSHYGLNGVPPKQHVNPFSILFFHRTPTLKSFCHPLVLHLLCVAVEALWWSWNLHVVQTLPISKSGGAVTLYFNLRVGRNSFLIATVISRRLYMLEALSIFVLAALASLLSACEPNIFSSITWKVMPNSSSRISIICSWYAITTCDFSTLSDSHSAKRSLYLRRSFPFLNAAVLALYC